MSLTATNTAKILLETIWRILVATLFFLVRLAYVNVQQILWRFNGTLQQVAETVHPENYERSVHILDILFRHSLDWAFPAEISHFLLAHNRFEHPSYILENDHVTLLTFTETHAVFAEARDRHAHLWKTQYGAFLRLAQIQHCSKLLFVPLQAFHRLSETVGDPDGRVIFLHSTGRCGSTLVVQMLNATDRIVAISEPDACSALWDRQLAKKQIMVLPVDQLRKDVIRLVCRPYKTIRPLVYLVKLPGYQARHMSLYQELFPNSRQLFMYRNALPSLKSQYRMMMGMVLPRTMMAVMPLLPDRFINHFWVSVGVLHERFLCEDKHKDMSLIGLGVMTEATVCYLESRQEGLEIEAIRYEDIVADPMYACKRILEFCGALENLLERALDGMKNDSQRSSPIAKAAVEKYKCPEFDEEFRQKANRLLRKHGLPGIEEELLLEGTITQRH